MLRRIWMVLFLSIFFNPEVFALSDAQIEFMRSDIRRQKIQIIAANVRFLPEEEQAFWPVYREYVRDAALIYDKKLALIRDFERDYEMMTDEKAVSLVRRFLETQKEWVVLEEKYFDIFLKSLSGITAAQFYQVDRKLNLMTDLQLLGELPLIRTPQDLDQERMAAAEDSLSY